MVTRMDLQRQVDVRPEAKVDGSCELGSPVSLETSYMAVWVCSGEEGGRSADWRREKEWY